MIPKIDYEELKRQISQGIVPEGLDPDVTVEDIEAFEAACGQPEDAPEAVFTEAEWAEFERKVWARIREHKEVAAELVRSEPEMEEWLKKRKRS